MLQSGTVRQIFDFVALAFGAAAAIVTSICRSIAELLPGLVWVGAAAVILALVLYGRLRARIDDVEMALVQLDAKLDTILSRLGRPREDRERRAGDDRSSP